MKLITILATLLLATIAQATPAVGDYSKFKLTVSNGQQTVVGSYEAAIIGEDEFSFKLSTTTAFPGQPAQHAEQSVTPDQLIADSDIMAILTDCSQYGGKLEHIEVPAGKYYTCALPTENGMLWLGKVPFGLVKQTDKTDEGHLVTLELETFIVGH